MQEMQETSASPFSFVQTHVGLAVDTSHALMPLAMALQLDWHCGGTWSKKSLPEDCRANRRCSAQFSLVPALTRVKPLTKTIPKRTSLLYAGRDIGYAQVSGRRVVVKQRPRASCRRGAQPSMMINRRQSLCKHRVERKGGHAFRGSNLKISLFGILFGGRPRYKDIVGCR